MRVKHAPPVFCMDTHRSHSAFFQKEIFVDIYSRKPPRTILGFFLCLSFKKPQWGLRGLNMNHVT